MTREGRSISVVLTMRSHRQESKAAAVCSTRCTLIGSLSKKKKLRTEYSPLEETHLSGKIIWSSVLFITPGFLGNKKMTALLP